MPQDDAIQVSHQLALEREKWQAKQELDQRKLTLMEREQLNRDSDLDLRRHEQERSKWSNPLVLSILAATLAAGSNAAVTLLNGYLQRNNEEARAESTRILEMIKTDDPDHAARNLEFLVKAGLVTEPGRLAQLKLFLDSRKPGEGPSLPASTPQFHFERSEYLTSSDRNRIRADLAEFVKYLSGAGFPVDAVPPSVRVDKSVEPRRPAYYSPGENLISIDPRLKDDLSLARHEYIHHILTSLARNWGNANQGERALESGLAVYFVASSINNPVLGNPSSAMVYNSSSPYLWNLDNLRAYDKVKVDRAPEHEETDEIWGGMLWEIRSRLGSHVADVNVLSAWKKAGEVPTSDPAKAFIEALLSSAQAAAPDKIDVIKDILRKRKFPIGP